jgi:hypothetical protein
MYNYYKYFSQIIVGSKRLAKGTGYPSIYFVYDCIWSLLRYGCINRHYFLGGFWKLRGVERKDSLTYKKILKAFRYMNDNNFIHLLERKEEFNAHFKDLIKRDWLYIRTASADKLDEFCSQHEVMMVKPISACEGHGIRKVLADDVRKESVEKVFDKWSKEDVIIEEVIRQDPRMVFGNKSVNTIRMYSVMDKHGNVRMLKALLRVGIGETVVDNYGSGGVFYEVDIDSGYIISTGNSHEKTGIMIHPQTDIVMLGYKIPHWDAVLSECEKACRMIPQVRFIAWDIAITSDGVEFIEGNENGDYELLEFTGTKLYWKVIKKYL